jgi:hypothetical protein
METLDEAADVLIAKDAAACRLPTWCQSFLFLVKWQGDHEQMIRTD